MPVPRASTMAGRYSESRSRPEIPRERGRRNAKESPRKYAVGVGGRRGARAVATSLPYTGQRDSIHRDSIHMEDLMASTLPLTQIEKALREKVATSCRIIGNRAVTRGSLGHVSARVPGTDRILIKAKGRDEEALEFAQERDVIVINIDGEVLE